MTLKTIRQSARRHNIRLFIAGIAALVLWDPGSGRPIVQAVSNPIADENALQGNDDSEWDITGAGDPTIQGFATDISVNTGQPVDFKIKTDSANYKIEIYRLGYYNGAGARKIATLPPSGAFTQPQNQAVPCATDLATGLVDCGKWAVSASWTSSGAVSGIYIAKLTRFDGVIGSSHIVFVVRDDARKADVLVQTADTTWQAYNQYGGASLYCAPAGVGASNAGTAYATEACPSRATKVSYNRPFDTRDGLNARSFLFSAEYPMVRWLEANGYDVKYWAGVDTDRRGSDLVDANKPKVFVSSGHDEYWSGDQRSKIEHARNLGVHLAFFSGNEMYWKTRYESSIDGSSTAYRTLVSYKETLASAKIDPAVDATGHPIWTGTWRDPRFSPPADGGRPENGVTGTIWTVNAGTATITVPAAMASLRFWRNTRVADLTSGLAPLAPDTLGYEWDEDLDNGARPTGLVHLSSTTVAGVDKIIDFGATTASGTATHSLTLYRHASGALVFSAGTVQWAWGLDNTHDGGSLAPDQAMQQSTMNLLADMGAQPATIQVGADPSRPLRATGASTDMVPPTSDITSPAANAQVPGGRSVMITGTAADTGGVVASVEVSVDGGATWHGAQGTTTWSFNWASPGPLGLVTIRSRAIDDSGNLGAAGAGVTVSVVAGPAGNCPCTTLWQPSVVPSVQSVADTNPVELGVKFKSDLGGFITGVRFYKGMGNFGTHEGSLWTLNGTLLATATFSNETSSGWQQVNFNPPVLITANTTYVASYHNNLAGGYAGDTGYFATTGVDSWPLHALRSDTTSGGNGVYTYGTSGFPTHVADHVNYWVDVVFAQTMIDASPLDISDISVTVIDGSTAVITWKTSKEATSRIDYSTDPSFPEASTFTALDGAFVTQHSVTLTGLTPNATYNFTITAKDRAGLTEVSTAPSFSVPGPTLHDTAAVDFLAGTQTATYIAQTADGEVTLAPTAGAEFSGPTLPAGWIATPWNSQGYALIANGVLLVDGARVASCVTGPSGACVVGETPDTTLSAIYTRPHSLEFSAKFSGDQFQHAGLGTTLNSASEPWALFSTGIAGGQLWASTNTGSQIQDTLIGTAQLGSFHRFRIDWTDGSVDYSIDGVLVVSHPLPVTLPMRPIAASDFNPFGGTVFVDWMRMTPYQTSGTFLSRVFDAKTVVNWKSAYWKSVTPSDTSLVVSVQTGNSPTPDDGTWTGFVPLTAPGPFVQTSRYIQYRAVMTTNDPTKTPALEDIILSTDTAPVAVNDAAATNMDTSYRFWDTTSLTLNDRDADGDTLRVTAVTLPAHGTAQLNPNGLVTYTPALGFTGNDSFTYTLSDGLLTATATVSMTVGGMTGINSTPVITWANPAAITYGTPLGALQLNATASDSGALVPGIFTYTPALGTVLDVGPDRTLEVTFAPTDSTLYTTAAATAHIAVNSAALTVRAGSGTKVYGTTDPALSATTATGLTAADALTIVLTSTRAVGEAVGNYATTANATGAALSNYTLTYVAGAFSITKARLTVTAGGGTRVYGAANPVLTVSYNGFVNGDTAASLTTQPTVSTTATATSAVGTYPITASGAVSANYTIGYVIGTLTITRALTTTAVNASSTSFRFGAPLTLTATVAVVAPGAGTPIGTVTFMDGGTAISGPVVLSAGIATFTTSSLVVGAHAATAVYSGGINFVNSGSSRAISITVNPDLISATTTVADFSTGTLDAGTYISDTGGGEIMLKPTIAAEFSGTALPAGWFSTANITKGTLIVSNGSAKLQGVQITTTSLFSAGRSLEFSATLAGDADQTVGMLLAHFNTKMNGSTVALYARTVNAPVVETLIPGNWFAGPHLFRVDWNATNIVYWIDGIKVATHNITFAAYVKMTAIGSDWMRNDVGWLTIHWMRLTPYAASGIYTSKVLNAGFPATWMNASWTADAPAGTNLVVSYRSGNTATPDGTWTAFTIISSSGAALSGVSQYSQFRLQETTTNPGQTPVVKDVTIVYR